jgi:filamentous hemagglutinin family protein
MNRTYRLIWSDVRQAYVAVAEIARARGKKSAAALLLSAVCLAVPAFAANLPEGGRIVAGSGSIAQSGNTLTVTQSSDKLAANWQSFSIGPGYAVEFAQPSVSAVALNRVLGSDVSVIQGALRANGQVFLINPNGVLFTPTAQVEVGGLIASTLNLTNEDFLAGRYRFAGDSANAIVNQGSLKTAPGGTVALIAARIENTGRIEAPRGNVLMGAGQAVTLDLGGPVKIQVEQGALNALIQQGGAIKADGGYVYLTAKAANDLASAAINHTGITEAKRLATGERGEIYLMGDMAQGQVNVAGTIEAAGGFVETSAAKVKVADGAQIKAGHWLIDPNDFTIAASGGDITGAAVSAALASGDVTIQTTSGGPSCTGVSGCGSGTAGNGDIIVDDPVSWGANTLTLSAYRDIVINRDLNGSGTAKLALEYGQGALALNNLADYRIQWNVRVNLPAGTNFSTKHGSDGAVTTYTVITDLGVPGDATATTLQGLNGNLSGNYALGADIDASATSGWNGGAGFEPIGPSTTSAFSGQFAGLGHTISHLVIDRPATDYVGLFGVSSTNRIRDLELAGGSIRGQFQVGALAGKASSNVTHCRTSASVQGISEVGGMVGRFTGTQIYQSYATDDVSASQNAGGLVGMNFSRLDQVYAGSNVRVSGANAGGLVGTNNGMIVNAYATGRVEGGDSIGGLVGINSGIVETSYATGAVSGTGSGIGGLVGSGSGTVSDSYWDMDTTGQTTSAGGSGLTSPGVFFRSSYTGFDDKWWQNETTAAIGNPTTVDGFTRPLLRMEATPVIATAKQLQLMNAKPWGNYILATDIDLGPALADPGGTWNPARGFLPIGLTPTVPFTGRLDGQGHTIGNLFISGNMLLGAVGLFGFTASSAHLRNLDMAGGSVSTSTSPAVLRFAGALVGRHEGTITDVSVSGVDVTSSGAVGGIVGAGPGDLVNSHYDIDTVRINGGYRLTPGGLYTAQYQDWLSHGKQLNIGDYTATLAPNAGYYEIGSLQGLRDLLGFADDPAYKFRLVADLDLASAPGLYVPEFRAAEFDGGYHVISNLNLTQLGLNPYLGLFGRLSAGSTVKNIGVENAKVTGSSFVGALAGLNEGVIRQSWASGSVTGINPPPTSLNDIANGYTGGLVGFNSGAVSDAYADVEVQGKTVGGLVGYNYSLIANSYAVGPVSGYYGSTIGGLVAANAGSEWYSFWDTMTSGQATSAAGMPGTTAQLQSLSTYPLPDWNIDSAGGTGKIWRIYEGHSYPLLRGFLTPITVTANSGSRIYDGTADGLGVSYSIPPDFGRLLGTPISSIGNKNVGTWTAGADGLWSDQRGYDIEYAFGSVTITPRPLSLIGLAVSDKTYDGTTAATLAGLGTLSGVISGDDVSVAGSASASFADKNAGTGKTVLVSGLALSGMDAGNYTLGGGGVTATASILPKGLTVSGITAANKVYDGTTGATVTYSDSNFAGLVSGDVVTASGAFADKNAGNGKTVHLTFGGADAGNYTFGGQSTASADITPKLLTASYSAASKVYDGNTAATVSATSGDILSGDAVTISASGAFADKNVGTGKSVSITGGALSGADAGNYTLANPTGATTADITPKPLTASYSASNKVYDGATATSVSATSGDIVTGDAVAIAASGAFADKNVGAGKTVNITGGALSGADAGNYTLANPTGSATADITPRPVQVTADAKSKFVGQSDPPLTYTTGCPTGMSADCGLVSGETLAGSLSRDAGEAVGAYAIRQGTVTDANNPNYAISYQGANLTIAASSGGGGGSSGGGSTGGGSTGGGSTGGGSTGGAMSEAAGDALASAQQMAFSGPGAGGPLLAALVRVEGSGIRLPEGFLMDEDERNRRR